MTRLDVYQPILTSDDLQNLADLADLFRPVVSSRGGDSPPDLRPQIVILLILIYQQLGVSAIVGALVSIVVITPLQFVVVWFLQKNKKGLLVRSPTAVD